MDIIRIIIAVLFVITLGVAIYEYFKMCRLLNEYSEEKLEDVLPELQARFKRLAIILYVFAGYLILDLILDIVFHLL